MITGMKNVQPPGLLGVMLSICLIFCQFQPGVAYKNAAYKKNVYVFAK